MQLQTGWDESGATTGTGGTGGTGETTATAPTTESQALYAAYLLGLTQSGSSAPGLASTTIDYDAAGRVISNIEINQLDIGKNVLTYYQQFAPTSTPSPFDAPVARASGYDAAGNLLAPRTVTASGGLSSSSARWSA